MRISSFFKRFQCFVRGLRKKLRQKLLCLFIDECDITDSVFRRIFGSIFARLSNEFDAIDMLESVCHEDSNGPCPCEEIQEYSSFSLHEVANDGVEFLGSE